MVEEENGQVSCPTNLFKPSVAESPRARGGNVFTLTTIFSTEKNSILSIHILYSPFSLFFFFGLSFFLFHDSSQTTSAVYMYITAFIDSNNSLH